MVHRGALACDDTSNTWRDRSPSSEYRKCSAAPDFKQLCYRLLAFLIVTYGILSRAWPLRGIDQYQQEYFDFYPHWLSPCTTWEILYPVWVALEVGLSPNWSPYIFISLQITSTCKCVSLETCQHACVSACICVCLQVCQLASLSACKCVSLQVCQLVNVSACKFVCLQVWQLSSVWKYYFIWVVTHSPA